MINSIVEADLKYITDSDVPWSDLEGKNILITGANGMLPSYMVETILFLNDTQLKNKAKIFAVVRNFEKAKKRFNCYLNRYDLNFVIQDIREPLTLTDNIDYLIHARCRKSKTLWN